MTDIPATQHAYLDTPEALAELVERLSDATRVAVDIEADSLHHYFEKVCLIQLSFDGTDYIVDPLVGLDLEPLLALLAGKPLIFHSGDYDLRMLHALSGFEPQEEVFDTMLAAQLLGFEQLGLAAVVERYLGVTLNKQSKKSNWSQRPLTEKQITYAYDDTHYLEPITDALVRDLEQAGRRQWHRQHCRRMVQAAIAPREETDREPWRIRGAGRLKPRELAFLRSLWHWRDSEARRIDRPPFMVLGNRELMAWAVWAAEHPGADIAEGPNLPRNLTGRRLAAFKAALKEARTLPRDQWPEKRRGERHPRPDKNYQPTVDRLREACADAARQLDIEPSVLAPRSVIEQIVRERLDTRDKIEQQTPLVAWQAELVEPHAHQALHNADPSDAA